MIEKIKTLILNKDERSRAIQINTTLNVVFKGAGLFCSFLLVPIALLYIDKTEYGVWLTLTSITGWLSYMDVGLGNGLRNKLTEAVAQGNNTLAREYVSTTYVLFGTVMLGLFIVFALCNVFLDWNSILKTNINSKTLLLTTYLIVLSFCIRLVLDLGGTVTIAMQKTYLRTLLDFSISLSTLTCIFLLSKTAKPSFALFSITVALAPVIVLIFFNYIIYSKSKYSFLKPSFKFFRKSYIKTLFNVGIQFFCIQFVGIIIFSTDNILITQFYSPEYVTSFNVAYKYFTIPTIAFLIIMMPYWSAFTHAYTVKDLDWINKAFKKLLKIWVIQVLGVILLIVAAGTVYRIWVGSKIAIPLSLSISLGVYAMVSNWNNVFAYFINGVGKIRLQLYSSIFVGTINIPLCYVLVKYTQLGVSSIVIANILCLLVSSVWSPIQCYRIINNSATGIWNK